MTEASGPSDEELAGRVRQGDEAAARLLFARHADLLRARARRRIGGAVRRKVGASDVVQETHLAAFMGIGTFEDRGPGSFRRWLERILDHKAADQVKHHVRRQRRSAKREVSQSADRSSAGPAAAGPSPSAVAAQDEERHALADAISETEGDDRTILELVHLQGKSFAEAGAAMGRTEDAARRLFGRVVLRLGRRMRGHP